MSPLGGEEHDLSTLLELSVSQLQQQRRRALVAWKRHINKVSDRSQVRD